MSDKPSIVKQVVADATRAMREARGVTPSAERAFLTRVFTTHDVPCAEASVEDDGDVSFDWSIDAGRVLSVSINAEGRIAWAGLFDDKSEHGDGWDDGRLDEMFKLIEEYT